MSKTVLNNLKEASPSWMVNLTAAMVVLTTVMPDLIDKMPGNVSDLTKDWIRWVMLGITSVISVMTALSKSSRIIGGRPNDR